MPLKNITNLFADSAYWYKLGLDDIEEALNRQINTGIAKNVILFLGDGILSFFVF